MNSILEFALISFTSIFTMVNPLGLLPVFVTMTNNLDPKTAQKVAIKASIISLIILITFAFAGKFIFDFFSISFDSLKVVGGIIFFMAGYDMLQARLIRTKTDQEDVKEYVSDISVTPLAIPMICGPGALTITVVLYNDAKNYSEITALFIVIFLVILITLAFMLGGRKLIRLLGENGNKVLMRLMGLIVMVIAVEFFVSGIKPLFRDLFVN
jgi:multiple antibiotic resistance protein